MSSRWDLQTFREEIVVAEDHPNVRWVLGVTTLNPETPVTVAWLDPQGHVISTIRHSLIVNESENKLKVSRT